VNVVDRPSLAVKTRNALLVAAMACAAMLFFYRFQIANGFTHAFGDHYDAMIEVAILQHWANVFAGHEAWGATQYFYPAARTLGYNDGYLVSGMIFSFARACGASPIAAAEFTHAAYKLAGFFGMYLLLGRRGGCGIRWALFGATLFTIADLTQQHANHGQLFTIAFAPFLVLLGWNAIEALRAGALARLWWQGAAFVLLFAAWFSTAFYLAWFFGLFCLILSVVAVIGMGGDQRRILRAAVTRGWRAVLAIVLIGGLAMVPFAAIYLVKAGETGMHAYDVVRRGTLTPIELIYPGPANIVWEPFFALIRKMLIPNLPLNPDDVFAMTPIVFGIAIAAILAARRGRLPQSLWWIGLSIVIAWVLMLRLWPESLWRIVYAIVPGAGAIRVVGRFQILLLVPVIFIVTIWLSRWPRRRLAILLAGLALVEQTSATGRVDLDRREQQVMLAAVPKPPADCQSFYVRASRLHVPPGSSGVGNDLIYAHNVDAMVLSEMLMLPTVNGFSTFNPPFWDFADPNGADYDRRALAYAMRFGLRGLCRLDVRGDPAWQRILP
jgi:hypothetical protein